MKLPIVLFSFLLAAAANHVGAAVTIRNCLSWRFAAEVNNARFWNRVPVECVNNIVDYMATGAISEAPMTQYQADLSTIVQSMSDYLSNLPPAKGNDIWVFDFVHTLLDDVEYYKRADVNYGATPYNVTKFNLWFHDQLRSNLPPMLNIPTFYDQVVNKGFMIAIVSELPENYRELVEAWLTNRFGLPYDRLILRNDLNIRIRDFKASALDTLKQEGYNVVGAVGDQWSDLPMGLNSRDISFKLPNPMYYVS